MSVNPFRSSLLGSPFHGPLVNRDGSTMNIILKRNTKIHASSNFRYFGKQLRGTNYLELFCETSDFSSSSSNARNDFRVSCTREPFQKTEALFKSLVPLWKEGIFFIRCSVFLAIISAAGVLMWYAQLKAITYIEAQLLPSVCSILSNHLKRDLNFGKVRGLSPLGMTLHSCSIGPHREEFSCAEVPAIKIRILPFSSLRRGKIVVDAVLFEPCLLVAQKEDFSWLGIPSSSESSLRRRHSSEEGIDYRTKVRRIVREESASYWFRNRVNKARESAELGYVVPEGHSALFLDDEMQDDVPSSKKSVRSSSFFCMDEEMHLKDHHRMDSRTKYSLKHAELEKSFTARTNGPAVRLWSRIIPHFIKHRFRRSGNKKPVSEGNVSTKHRILSCSASAALSFFKNLDGKSFTDPFFNMGTFAVAGGNTISQVRDLNDQATKNNHPRVDNGIYETRSEDVVEVGKLDHKVIKSQVPFEAADDIPIAKSNSKILRDVGIRKDKNTENQHQAEDHISESDNYDISDSQSSLQDFTVVKAEENTSEDDKLKRKGDRNLQEFKEQISDNSSKKVEHINGQSFNTRKFGMFTQFYQSASFWQFTLKHVKIGSPFAFTNLLWDNLIFPIQKIKPYFKLRGEDLSAELVGEVAENNKGIEKILPITLDSVYFSGGTLMLLGYGDREPREMVKVNGHVGFERQYSRVHVQLNGNCMEWRQDHTSQGGGKLSTDIFLDIFEQKWHANVNFTNLFAPLFEGILEIPITGSSGRATGEVHICMSKGDSFPSLHGQLDVTGLSFGILEAPASFSELTASLSFRGQRAFLHNASGWFGDAPIEASGDFGINPDDGEFHLMCQIPSVEVNALMKTLNMRPLLFPLAGSVTAVFNCQGPLDAPVFVGSGIISRKASQSVSSFPPSSASEAVLENKEAGAVAAIDRIPFSHVSANFTFNMDNCVADLYGIRVCLLDGGEIRGAGSAWICSEGETDDTAMDVNLSGNFVLEKVLARYVGKSFQLMPAKIGELNGETRLSGTLLRPRFDIKWAAPKAEESFGDARGEIIICHDYITVASSSIAFDLYTKVQTSYHKDDQPGNETTQSMKGLELIIDGVDLDLRLRAFEFGSLIHLSPLDSPRSLHLKATGKIKFQGEVVKTSHSLHDGILEQDMTDNIRRLVGEISLSGIKLNQLMIAPQLAGSLSISRDSLKLSATGRPDENLTLEALWSSDEDSMQEKRLLSFSLQKGQLRTNIFYQPNTLTNLEVRNLPLDELELASLRGYIPRVSSKLFIKYHHRVLKELLLGCSSITPSRGNILLEKGWDHLYARLNFRTFISKDEIPTAEGELQLNFQKRRGHGLFSVLQPKFSGVLGEALDVAARWSGDVITVEKIVLEQASSRYEFQGEYVVPGTRERYPINTEGDGFFKQATTGHLASMISSMGRWRMRLEVPNAEVSEMLPLARLLSRSTDPSVQSRSKDLFVQTLQSVGFCAENLHDQLKAIQNQFNLSDDNFLEGITLPGLAEFRGHWSGSLDASGGGNGDTMADFNFQGDDWEWGNYKTQRILAAGAYSNRDGLRLEKLFIQKDNATLHADGTVLGPITNLHFAVLNFPVGLVPTLVQIIETSTSESILSLRQWLTPIKGIFHMEGDLKGSLTKPECDVQIRLLDGTVGGIDLGRAEIVASLTSSSRFLFNANFEPVTQSGHVHIQGSVPVTYVQHDSIEEVNKEITLTGNAIRIPVWAREYGKGSDEDIAEKKLLWEKNEEGWDFQLVESLRGLNWNILSSDEVRINADIKDGGMALITALNPYANWLNGYADISLQVRGTVDQPVLDGSAIFHRASVSSPVLRKPLTNFGGTIQVNSNRLCITSIESRVSRKGKLLLKGNLPLKSSESSTNDKLDLKCEVLEVRAKNIFSGQVDSQIQIMGSILQPNISGMIRLSHGEAYLPHDKGNGTGANRLALSPSSFPSADYNRWPSSGQVLRSFSPFSASSDNKWPRTAGKQSEVEKKMDESTSNPGNDVRLTNMKVVLGPELRIVYPLILNFAVSGELELDGMAHPKFIRPRGVLTFENGDVNLVATQVRLKRDHLNVAKFEPDFGLDPILDLALVGSEWQFRIQSQASTWQDNLVVTSTRSVDQDALTPNEAAKVFESQLAESLLESDGQLAFKKLATTTLEKLMPRIEGKGEFGQARWRLVYAPQIPSLLSVDPTADPLKSLANNISFGTEVEVQLGKRLQATVVRQMKDSEMAMQWTLIYKLTSRLRVLFQSSPSNRLLFEYSATAQD